MHIVTGVIATANLTTQSAGSLIKAIEESQNLLYVVKNLLLNRRAHDEGLLNNSCLVEVKSDGNGSKSGQWQQDTSTKTNKKQQTKKAGLQCTSVCPGKLVLTDEGRADPASFCPAHLVEHCKALVRELLGSAANMGDLPLYASFCRVEDLKPGTTLVMSAESSVADRAGLGVCTVTKDEMMAGIMYNREVPFEYEVNGKSTQFYPPVRGHWFEIAGSGYAARAWAESRGVTAHLRKQLGRVSERSDTEVGNLQKVTSKTMRRTFATVMNKKISMPELCSIAEWSSEAMARRYIECCNQFAGDTPNYSDIGLGVMATKAQVEKAMQPVRRQSRIARVPHKEMQYTAAELAAKERQKQPCHPRAEGEHNPLRKKDPAVEAVLLNTLWDEVAVAQSTLCSMGCHCSRTELQGRRQPLRRKLKQGLARTAGGMSEEADMSNQGECLC